MYVHYLHVYIMHKCCTKRTHTRTHTLVTIIISAPFNEHLSLHLIRGRGIDVYGFAGGERVCMLTTKQSY